jgi:hypothetical protein
VTGYGMDGLGLISGKGKILVSTFSRQAHPDSYPVGMPGIKRPSRVSDHSPPSSAEVPCSAEWTPFQIHYVSENLILPGNELGTSGSVARNSDH